MNLIPLPAFSDNYIWMWHNDSHAVVVDPGDAAPVLQVLQDKHLKLSAILVTHHHADHVGGVAQLQQATGAIIYAPANEDIGLACTPCSQDQIFNLLGCPIRVIELPGHTSGHIAFFIDQHFQQPTPIVFCGDTLFSAGCGRIFEGTPAQMLNSLDKLAQLPNQTLVCCAHEYTLSNMKFAAAVDPENIDLLTTQKKCIHLREHKLPTLPSNIELEKKINPFLRSRTQPLIDSITKAFPQAQTEIERFAALREWKNQFK